VTDIQEFGAFGRTMLGQGTVSCSTIMLLPTTQLSSSSFSQRKALLLITTPLLARFGICGLLSIP